MKQKKIAIQVAILFIMGLTSVILFDKAFEIAKALGISYHWMDTSAFMLFSTIIFPIKKICRIKENSK